MKRALLIPLLLLAGCATYTQAKIGLTDQIRRGVSVTRQATIDRQRVADELARAQVERIDAAFDADVTSRRALTPEWVIAHRKAYVAARDAAMSHRLALRSGQATIEGNLDAVDAALAQLQAMHQLEARLTRPEEKP